MNVLSKKLSVVLAAAACLLGACTKTPPRPDPSATVLGPQSGGSNIVQPTDLATLAPGTDLQTRDPNAPYTEGNLLRNPFGLERSQVYFDFDRSDIKAAERAKFPAVKEYLDQNPGTRVIFEGFCDWRGTAEYNLGLGDRRANAAKRYLQSLGVPADRIETISKGSLEAAKNADEAQMAKDRRATIVIVLANTTQTPL